MMITLQDARRGIAAAEKKAEEIGQPMNIAVVDEGGNLVAHVRMDKAWIGSVDISINKAWTARAFDIATKDMAEQSQSGDQFFGIHVSNRGREMIYAGGIPGQLVSARPLSIAVLFSRNSGRCRACLVWRVASLVAIMGAHVGRFT